MDYLLVFVVLVIFCLIAVRYTFPKTDLTDDDRQLIDSALAPLADDSQKVNCLHVPRYCTDDSHCIALCASELSSDNRIICREGVCDTDTTPLDTSTCEAKFGFLSVFNNNELQSRWLCINTLPHLFQENGQVHPYVCGTQRNTGLFDRKCFDADQSINAIPCCKCNEGYIRAVEVNIPDVPLCVHKDLPLAFPSFIPV